MVRITSIEDLCDDEETIKAAHVLVQEAMLSDREIRRNAAIYLLWCAHKDEPFKLTGGFMGDNEMFLQFQSADDKEIWKICDLPREYKGRTISEKNIHAFDKEEIARILYGNRIYSTREYFLEN